MNDDMRRMVEREQRKQLTAKIIRWEAVNGMVLMPMKRDITRPRILQLVDEAMMHQTGTQNATDGR